MQSQNFYFMEVTKMSETYGYIRVSTKEQNEGRQMLAMERQQVPASNIYLDNIKKCCAA